MSYIMYLASDCPLKEVENAHYQTRVMSFREAAAAGIRLPDWFDGSGIDKDMPGAVLWQEKDPFEEWQREENGGDGFDEDYSIMKLSDDIYEIETKKKYRAEVAWGRYSEGRARNIIAYIRKHLEQAEELEIWSLWQGDGNGRIRIRKKRLTVDELSPEWLERLAAAPHFKKDDTEYRIEGLPADILRELEQGECCESTQYCLVVGKAADGRG